MQFGPKKFKVVAFLLAFLLFSTSIAPVSIYGLQSSQTTANLYVGTYQCSFNALGKGKYEAEIYYPTNDSGKPYPVIIFAHGLSSCKEWHKWIGNILAINGYVALLFSVPNPISTDVLKWVDGIEGGIECLEQLNNGSDQFQGMMNMSRLGVMGHSMGAMAALIAASENPKIQVVVSLAAPYMKETHFDDEYIKQMKSEMDWDSVLFASSNLTKPVQFQVGTLDAFTEGNARTYFEATNSPFKEFVIIEGGNHVQFLDDDTILSRSTLQSLFSLLRSLDQATLLRLMQYIGPRILLVLFQETLTEVPVALLIDRPATITPQEQQEISSKNFLSFFFLHL